MSYCAAVYKNCPHVHKRTINSTSSNVFCGDCEQKAFFAIISLNLYNVLYRRRAVVSPAKYMNVKVIKTRVFYCNYKSMVRTNYKKNSSFKNFIYVRN